MPIFRSKQTVDAMQWRGSESTDALTEFLGDGVVVAEAPNGNSCFLANVWGDDGPHYSQSVRIARGDYVFKNGSSFSIFGEPGCGTDFLRWYEQVSP